MTRIISTLIFLLPIISCGIIGNDDKTFDTDADANIALALDTVQRPSLDTTRKNIILENLFEDENFLRGFLKGQSCCEYSVTQSDAALRFEVRKDDPMISGSVRSEVTGKGYTNEERWYGFRLRLEDWEMDEAGEHVIQFHPNSSKGSATLALWTNNGTYTLVISPHGDDNRYYELGAVESDKNTDFVFHIKWTNKSDGIIEVWKDGKYITKTQNDKELPYEGITTWSGCYLKLGINKFGWSYEPARTESRTKKRVMYFEEFREGNEHAKYEDVAPR